MEHTFKGHRSLTLRVWHWLNLIAILGLLGTGFLRKTFMGWRTTSGYMDAGLKESGTTVAPEVLKEIAIQIRTPMWDFHYIFGFMLVGLFLARIVIAFLPGQSSLLPDLKKMFARPDKSPHHILGKLSHVAMYGILAFMVASGVLMYFKGDLGLSKDLSGWLKSNHELMIYAVAGFVVLHVLGVFIAENRGDSGLVSDMINGGPKSS